MNSQCNGCSVEEVTIDSLYAQRRPQIAHHGRSHSNSAHFFMSSASSSDSRQERTSAIFSFFRWFRKESRSNEFDPQFSPSAPPSPPLIRGYSSSCGSVDTLFSTATASSFAFINPALYVPFCTASPPEKRIIIGPETETYRSRLKQRDRLRELDKNLTLKKKYHLFGSDTLHNNLDNVEIKNFFPNKSLESLKTNDIAVVRKNSTLSRKKRKAPPPPLEEGKAQDLSLPTTLTYSINKSDASSVENHSKINVSRFRHRRTVSDSAKDKTSGAFVHVKGKRKAPPPPVKINNNKSEEIGNSDISGTQSLGRKKRPAPPPPFEISSKGIYDYELGTQELLSHEEKQRLIDNITKLQAHAGRRSLLLLTPPDSPTLSSLSKMSHSVCNDSLKLEKGVLKANKTEVQSSEAKHVTATPVSPRPWYKRSGINKEKSLEKKKEKGTVEDWMPEVAIVRGNLITQGSNISNSGKSSSNNNSYRLSNIFSRFEKPEEKRKSQISMLVNISELDREAAEILQREQEKEKEMFAMHNAKFYTSVKDSQDKSSETSMMGNPAEENKLMESSDPPKKTGTQELISLFNAIGNVTKVTVNSAFFSKEGPSIFTKEGIEKRFSKPSESVKGPEEDIFKVNINKTCECKKSAVIIETKETYSESPGVKRRKNNHPKEVHYTDSSSSSFEAETSKIRMEEIENFDEEKSKTQTLHEANKIRKHQSPSPTIPTIVEMSESGSSVATLTGSIIDTVENSTSVMSNMLEPSVISEPSAPKLKKNYSIWSCPRCTLENPRWRVTCEACDMWRPAVRRDVIDKLTNPNMGATIAVNIIKTDEPKSSFVMRNPTSQIDSKIPLNANKERDVNKIEKKEFKSKNPVDYSSNVLSRCSKIEYQNPITVSGLLSNNNFGATKLNNLENTDKVSKSNGNTSLRNSEDSLNISVSTNSNNKSEISDNRKKTSEHLSESSPNSKESEEVSITENEHGVEVVRKARLAFFGKSQLSNEVKIEEKVKENTIKQNPSINQAKIDAIFSISSKGSLATNDEERLKVKEMLKEMKNSLPKKSKDIKIEEGLNRVNTTKNKKLSENAPKKKLTENPSSEAGSSNPKKVVPIGEEKYYQSESDLSSISNNNATKSGVIKKSLGENIFPSTSKTNKKMPCENPKIRNKSEFCLGKSKTMIEEIEIVDKPRTEFPIISTAVQTNRTFHEVKTSESVITSEGTNIISGKPPTPKDARREILIPTTIEENTVEDGILQITSLKEPQKKSIRSFELIRPRDFLNIEATKTGNIKAPGVHVYANVPTSHNEDSSTASISISSSDSQEISQLTAQLTKPKGLADFKAAVLGSSMGNKMNTLAVNRLLRQLESAIAGGQHQRAATLAKELARHKINCCVIQQKEENTIQVDMYVEDKLSHQGPFPVQISPSMTVAQLKVKVEREFEIPTNVQRWILGKELAADDRTTLQQLTITKPHCPIFLYLVAPDGAQEKRQTMGALAGNELSKGSPMPEKLEAASCTNSTPLPPQGRGWYFNEEDDRYSLCDSEVTDESSEDLEPQGLEVPVYRTVVQNVDEVRGVEVVENEVEEAGAISEPLAAEKTTNSSGTLTLGWKCGVCTLMNSPTRPGCSACATERPTDYQIPPGYEASGEERQRIEQDQYTEQAAAEDKLKNYQELMVLENSDLIYSTEPFECSVCLMMCRADEGVVLRDCLHTFCRTCLLHTVQFSEDAEVKCPFRDRNYACDSALQEREIKALVPTEVYEQHLAKSVAQAENKMGNTFHCKTPDCPGWCIFEDNVNIFHCPVCSQPNCLTCQAIHSGMDCKQYQEWAKQEAETNNADARRTREMLEEMVQRGEALPCPTCQVVLMKKWGCDWLRCSMCKTEICWVTRGPRWGPNGKGDTSGGCQCGVNGVKCHPKCNYCH